MRNVTSNPPPAVRRSRFGWKGSCLQTCAIFAVAVLFISHAWFIHSRVMKHSGVVSDQPMAITAVKSELLPDPLATVVIGSSRTSRPVPAVIECKTSKGKFHMHVKEKESPKSARVLLEMVRQNWFNEEDGGVAFFRVNDVATQFGVKQRQFKFNWKALNLSSEWERDLNLEPDKRKRHSWPRGVVYMIGGTQMVIVRANGHHGQGHGDFETVVATIPEEDMKVVFDNLHAYNDHIDHPRGGLGPDQTDIYRNGWSYLNEKFPLVDRIYSCHRVS